MKSKALLFAGFCAFALCASPVQATNREPAPLYYNEVDNPPTGFEEIILHGNLNRNAGPNAIIAGASDNAVYLHFNQSFGYVNIGIYNATGLLVYSTVVNTNVQPTVIIPFENVNTGVYTVVLDNADGYADGDFERH